MKTRIVYTKIWKDGWFGELKPEAQNLFWYLLTNENVNIIQLFEIPTKQIAYDTNLEIKAAEKILKQFEQDGKIDRCNDYILLTNAHKYETYSGYKSAYQKIAIVSALGDEELAHYKKYIQTVLDDVEDEIDPDDERHNKLAKRFERIKSRFEKVEVPNGINTPKKPEKQPEEPQSVPQVVEKSKKYDDLTPAQQMRAFVEDEYLLFGEHTDAMSTRTVVKQWLMGTWKVTEEVAQRNMLKFLAYWTEPTKNGKKQRWEQQKTFELKRRFITWMSRDYNQPNAAGNGGSKYKMDI